MQLPLLENLKKDIQTQKQALLPTNFLALNDALGIIAKSIKYKPLPSLWDLYLLEECISIKHCPIIRLS